MAVCCSAPVAARTPRLPRSPGRPGWSGGWARSSRPGAGSRIDYAWWGLVCLARDLLPHLGWLDDGKRRSAPWPITAAASPSPPCSGAQPPPASPAGSPDPPLPGVRADAAAALSLPGCGVLALRAAYLAYGIKDEWPEACAAPAATTSALAIATAAWPSAASRALEAGAIVEAARPPVVGVDHQEQGSQALTSGLALEQLEHDAPMPRPRACGTRYRSSTKASGPPYSMPKPRPRTA